MNVDTADILDATALTIAAENDDDIIAQILYDNSNRRALHPELRGAMEAHMRLLLAMINIDIGTHQHSIA